MSTRMLSALALISLTACQSPDNTNPQDMFMAELSKFCGQSFEGKVVSDDPRDADWAKEVLTMHVRDCGAQQIRIPLHVGDNRSRTWIITKTPQQGLSLKHDHRHEDGHEDVLTQYGGDTANDGTSTRQSFPADQYSKDLFVRENIPDSAQNIWSINLESGVFTYQLDRPNRHFKAQFDLTKPVATPPPAWGYEPQNP